MVGEDGGRTEREDREQCGLGLCLSFTGIRMCGSFSISLAPSCSISLLPQGPPLAGMSFQFVANIL